MKALISVYDKTGIIEFAKKLVDSGVELISTGGTPATLIDRTRIGTDQSNCSAVRAEPAFESNGVAE